MAKTSNYPIENLNVDWSLDPNTGLKFSGASVQAFIKKYLGAIAKAAYFDASDYTMYWFASEEDKDAFLEDTSQRTLILYSTQLSFSSDLYRIALVNNTGATQLNVATNEVSIPLSVSYDVQTKAMTESSWRSTGKGVFISAFVDIGATGQYEMLVERRFMPAEQTFVIDVKDDLITGINRVRLLFESEDDSSLTASITYTINLTEMFIEPLLNEWYKPIVEGGDTANYKLGGFRIVGAVSKTLHIDVYSGSSRLLQFEKFINLDVYDRVPYYYRDADGLDLSSLATGVYVIVAYLTSGTLTSKPVSYNVMYIRSEDQSSARLLCINNVESLAYNYTTAKLFEYCIYNQSSAFGSLSATVKLLNGTATSSTEVVPLENVTTSEAHSFDYPLEWLTEENLNLNVQVTMEYGNEQVATIRIDNSATFPPTSGFEFYLNAAARANTNTNYLNVVNQVSGVEYTPTWEKMTWGNNVDGWTHDNTDRQCLLIPARAKMTLPYTDYRILDGDNISIELCYRVFNVADYDEDIITICNDPTAPGFRGIKIKPTSIIVHSSEDTSSIYDYSRGTKLIDERVVHFVLTIYSNHNGNPGRNLVTGYINGCKNFQFEYNTGAVWYTNADFVIGAERSDVALYFMRIYRSVLSDVAVQTNFINSMPTIGQREDLQGIMKSVMDANGSNVEYQAVRDSGKNFFIIETLNGATLPSRANGWTKDDDLAIRSNLEMHYGDNPSWDWRIENVETAGQGTTSMGYYRWNLRWRIDKSTNKKATVKYLTARRQVGNSYVYDWGTGNLAGSVDFDGTGNHPSVKRITAKINFASSMQSHKIGATRAYTELHDHSAVGLSNEAQRYADSHNLPSPTVAVYQYPVYGFQKSGNTYTFIGLYTIGPDKGDKPTFGYNIDSSISDNLITLEGSDHDRVVVMFNHPWNEEMEYRTADEFLNVTEYIGNKRGGWEVGNCHTYDTGEADDQANVQRTLEEEFKPAYDLVFNNSTMIFGVSLGEYGQDAESTLAAINANVATFGGAIRTGNRVANSNYQFWIEGEYILYYLDARTNQYVAGADLIEEHGTPQGSTIDEENEWFKAQRRTRFMASAEEYWDIQDALYHYAFIIAIGAVDNFGKNTYPYKMAAINFVDGHNLGGKWKWRQDDLDSALGINNSGFDTVPSYSEFADNSSPGAAIYGGSPSVFWTLIHECYMEDYTSTLSNSYAKGIRSMGKAVLTAMSSSAGGANIFEGVLLYFKNTFWDNAQNYFPQSAYNADAVYKYEAAWIARDNQQADPLGQSLGNHFEAEYYWVYNRAIYLMSLFRAGPFGVYNDANLGQIAFRPVGLPELTVTPAFPMYPGLGDGTTMRNGVRTNAGEPYTFVGPFSQQGQTTMYINAADFLSYLGDWKDLQVNTTLTPSITIIGKKLMKFKIGDAEEQVTTNVAGLSFGNEISSPGCLETIDARNAVSISGSTDVSKCTRLKEAYFEGTSLTQIKLANGQRIEILHLSEYTTSIVLKGLKLLEELVVPSDPSSITLIDVENCGIDGFDILSVAFNAENSSLQFIKLVFSGVRQISLENLYMLLSIASGQDKDGNEVEYGSVSDSGAPVITSGPYIEGTIQSDFYAQDFDRLNIISEEDYQTNLKKALSGIFNTSLYIIYDPNNIPIRFADSTVESICLGHWDTNGDGMLTTGEAKAVTGLSTYFRENTEITSFDELKYFTGMTSIYGNSSAPYGAFGGCTNLKSVTLPSSITSVGNSAFRGSGLTSFVHERQCSYANNAFYGCTSLAYIDVKVSSVGYGPFIAVGKSSAPGTLIIRGTFSGNGSWSNSYFKKITITGNLTSGFGTYINSVQEFRVGGNITAGAGSLGLYYPNSATKFFECMGTLYNSTGALFYASYAMTVHLGYNGVVAARPAMFKLHANTKIYVGPGESQAGDEAVLELYRNDADWGQYVTNGKVLTWWSYNGTYKE